MLHVLLSASTCAAAAAEVACMASACPATLCTGDTFCIPPCLQAPQRILSEVYGIEDIAMVACDPWSGALRCNVS
jgi:hypothetical protein